MRQKQTPQRAATANHSAYVGTRPPAHSQTPKTPHPVQNTSVPKTTPASVVPSTPHTTTETHPPVSKYAKATETQWKTYQSINEWTRFADVKAGAVLTANGAMLAAAVTALNGNFTLLRTHHLALYLAIASVVALVASVGCCLGCILPKTNLFHRKHDPETTSLLYFGHIADLDKEVYRKQAEELSVDETAYQQIAQQVWINARVAKHKNNQVAAAVIWLTISILGALSAALAAVIR